MKKLYFMVIAMRMLLSYGGKNEKEVAMEEAILSGLMKSGFISEVDGKPTALYMLESKKGAETYVANWGGCLVSVMVPGRNGRMTDVVLGYDNIAQYVTNPDMSYDALIGRYGNHIANDKFMLDETEYQLPQSNSDHYLRGGPKERYAVVWDVKQIDDQVLELTYLSRSDEAGLPGNLDIKVVHKLTDDNAVDIKYKATTDKPTVVNLTNHSYLNPSSVSGSQIMDHMVMIDTNTYNPVDETLIPTGIEPVEGTLMGLRKPVVAGVDIDNPFMQLVYGDGYDHNQILNTADNTNETAAKVISSTSGIVMEAYTSEPDPRLYAGNSMTKTGDKGRLNVVHPHRNALCLEIQHYPDSPNQPAFPSIVFRLDERYTSECTCKFSIE